MGKTKSKYAARKTNQQQNLKKAKFAKNGKVSPYAPNGKELKKLYKKQVEKRDGPQLLPIYIYIETHNCREVTVHWMVNGLTEDISSQWGPFGFHILVESSQSKITVVDEYIRDCETTTFELPCHLRPGKKYNFQISACKFPLSVVELGDLAHGSITHTPVLTTWELNELMHRAGDFIRSKGNPINIVSCLYRNKPFAYFDRIRKERNGIMEVYTKDWNGDPGCPINGQIDGLFFNTRIDPKTGEMPLISPFGDTRIVIPTQKLIDASLNMYFADFYCLTNDHYVTLVVTQPGSKADEFCAGRLIALSFTGNPFFVQIPLTDQFFCSTAVWVELLYTENVDITEELCDETSVFYTPAIHGGSSTLLGKPKKSDCPICNL